MIEGTCKPRASYFVDTLMPVVILQLCSSMGWFRANRVFTLYALISEAESLLSGPLCVIIYCFKPQFSPPFSGLSYARTWCWAWRLSDLCSKRCHNIAVLPTQESTSNDYCRFRSFHWRRDPPNYVESPTRNASWLWKFCPGERRSGSGASSNWVLFDENSDSRPS